MSTTIWALKLWEKRWCVLVKQLVHVSSTCIIPELYLLTYMYPSVNVFKMHTQERKKSISKNKSHLLTIENNNNSTQKNL